MANAFPAAMSRVGLLAGPHRVGVASTLGYGGFLLGPPVIGFLTAAVGLGPALTTVSALALVSAALGLESDQATSRERKRTRQQGPADPISRLVQHATLSRALHHP